MAAVSKSSAKKNFRNTTFSSAAIATASPGPIDCAKTDGFFGHTSPSSSSLTGAGSTGTEYGPHFQILSSPIGLCMSSLTFSYSARTVWSPLSRRTSAVARLSNPVVHRAAFVRMLLSLLSLNAMKSGCASIVSPSSVRIHSRMWIGMYSSGTAS